MSGPEVIQSQVGMLSGFGAAINALVTWLLVILGWGVVQDQARFQEAARSNIQRLDSLRLLLDELEALALEMHRAAFDELKTRRIRRLLKKIAVDCKLLVQSNAMDTDWTMHMVSIRQAITLQNFDKSIFQPQEPESAVLAAIEAAKDNFESYVTARICSCAQAKRTLFESLRSALSRKR